MKEILWAVDMFVNQASIVDEKMEPDNQLLRVLRRRKR